MLKICYLILLLCTTLPAGAIGVHFAKAFNEPSSRNAKTWDISTAGGDYVFFATQEAMYAYNGNDWKAFSLNNGTDLRSVHVSLTEGRVYAGGINEFGYFEPGIDGSLTYTCLSDSTIHRRELGNIWGIYEKDHIIYVQGDHNVMKYSQEGNRAVMMTDSCKLDCSAMINGTVYLGTDRGLKFVAGDDIFTAPGADLLKGKRIRGILPSPDGIIIVTATEGVFLYNRKSLKRLDKLDRELARTGELFCAAINGNRLALGSIHNGVKVIDLDTGLTQLYNENNGLQNNTVLSLAFDERGDLWAGLDRGIEKIMLEMPATTFSNGNLPIGAGYVTEIMGDKMYLGTNRGLYTVNYPPVPENGLFSFTPVNGTTGQVWGLRNIDGEIICSHDRGTFVINGASARNIDGICGSWDCKLMPDGSGRAIVGAYDGFYIIAKHDGQWTMTAKLQGYDGCPNNFVLTSPSEIWASAGADGVSRLTIDPAAMKVIEEKRFVVTADSVSLTKDVNISLIDGNVYFATSAGIYIYNLKTGAIEPDDEMNEILGGKKHFRRLKKDRGGNIYALTSKEILRFDPHGGNSVVARMPLFGYFPAPMHEGDLLYFINDSTVIFPGYNGYTFFNFSHPGRDTNLKLHPARINEVSVTTPSDSLLYTANFTCRREKITINYAQNSLRISYGIADDARSGLVSYSYRLSGEEWSAPTPATVKEYTNLKDGRYRFEIKATTIDGTVDTDSIEFTILPPWYKSRLAIAIYVALAMILIVALIKVERHLLSVKERRVVREKDRELAQRQADFEKEAQMKDRKIMELEKEKLHSELQHKSQEMANAMASIASKNETLINVKQELRNIYGKLNPGSEQRKAILALQNSIDVSLQSDDVMKRFEDEFDLVHNDFMKNLRSRYPDLSNNEVLLCAYIKMNLSTKEIAPLMNISVRGMETMRYRIRKKFNLEREESLQEFLAKNN